MLIFSVSAISYRAWPFSTLMVLTSNNIRLIYNDVTSKVKILLPDNIRLFIGEPLAGMLGLSREQISINPPVHQGSFAMDMTRGIDSIYVYTDIIQTKLVGDSCVPLLRVVPVEGKFGDEICKEYNSPLYSPVAKHDFSTIELYLMDSAGRHISFTSGKVTVLLFFIGRFY